MGYADRGYRKALPELAMMTSFADLALKMWYADLGEWRTFVEQMA